jgi:lysozyme
MMSTLLEMVKEHEGLRLKPYTCTAGKLTIGYGRNIEDVGISEEEATFLLNNDIRRCKREAEQWCGQILWNKLSPNRQDVVIEMCFQLGLGTLQKFKKFKAALDALNFRQAAAEMLDSSWAQQTSKRAKTLAKLMEVG